MPRPLDMTGRKFGKWTVISLDPNKPANSICQCECGVIQSRKSAQIRWAENKGIVQSCQSCAAIRGGTTHGQSKTPEHIVWVAMLDRCNRETHPFFHRYGGRGISVCERWHDYANFISDVGIRPSKKHSLDRINNDGNYEPSNCRWATQKVQLRNTSVNRIIEFNGQSKCLVEWSEETGISAAAIKMRIDVHKWSIEDALTIKPGKAFNWRGTKHKDAALIAYNGEYLSHIEWEKRIGAKKDTIRNRLKRGWTIEKAVTTPVGKYKRKD